MIDARFWSKVDAKNPGGCWEWQGAVQANGYGRFNVGNRVIEGAHRVAYRLAYGKVPAGMFVCHKCDNPRCVNPDHLFAGTHQDNMSDMSEKGRHFTPFKSFAGSKHPMAKLNRIDVERVRDMHTNGCAQNAIARYMGVSVSHVNRLVRNMSWSHA